MGKITPEMEKEILEHYALSPKYKAVGEELGVDWRTVKGVVERERRKKPDALSSKKKEEVPLCRVSPN